MDAANHKKSRYLEIIYSKTSNRDMLANEVCDFSDDNRLIARDLSSVSLTFASNAAAPRVKAIRVKSSIEAKVCDLSPKFALLETISVCKWFYVHNNLVFF